MLCNELRDYAEQLGRFATATEKRVAGPKGTASHKHQIVNITCDLDEKGQPIPTSPILVGCKGCTTVWTAKSVNLEYDPSDRILIQGSSAGNLTFVAGTGNMTLMVMAGATQARGKALVSARLFLNAVKTLRGKDEVTVNIDQYGACLTVGAAKLTLPNVDDKMPRWVRPEAPLSHGAELAPKEWPEVARALDEASGKFWPYGHASLRVAGKQARLTAMDGYVYFSAQFGAEDDDALDMGGVPVTFIGAARYLQAESLSWGDNTFVVHAGAFTAVAKLEKDHFLPIPGNLRLRLKGEDGGAVRDTGETFLSVDKKTLVGIVKGLALNDEWNRMALVTKNQTLTVHPYTNDNASMRVPATVEGADSRVYVAADLLQKALRVSSGKTVSLRWSSGKTSPVWITGDKPWTLLLAPVAL